VYPDLLEANGWRVGFQGKGWGPGNDGAGGRTRNPAGPRWRSFRAFLETVPDDAPFCFWFGSTDPHRPYEEGSGRRAGYRIEDVSVPPFFPDTPDVRSDILDYHAEVERFDRDVAGLLATLEMFGRTGDTIVVVTSDNGMPFPRSKANLYDAGTHMPLVVRWPGRAKAGSVVPALVSLADLAPTFLEAAGAPIPPEMTGRSLVHLIEGKEGAPRTEVFLERERHANVREGDLGYPARAVRTEDFLYIRNFRPDRWPAGDPEKWRSVGPFGDVDDGITKRLMLDRREDPAIAPLFRLAFGKRPAEELYDLRKDPGQMTNVAGEKAYAHVREQLAARLLAELEATGDPRAVGGAERLEAYPYYGGSPMKPGLAPRPQ
jgi:arylsulfatase A-like enzyme